MHTIALAGSMSTLQGPGPYDWKPIAELMLRSAEVLKRAGAKDFSSVRTIQFTRRCRTFCRGIAFAMAAHCGRSRQRSPVASSYFDSGTYRNKVSGGKPGLSGEASASASASGFRHHTSVYESIRSSSTNWSAEFRVWSRFSMSSRSWSR